jgi:hypothetical protein
MASKARPKTADPTERPSIPDPLGDDRSVGVTGNLTGGGRDREGLLRSGSTPREDGGVAEHPVHDEDVEGELDAEDYEQQFDDARKTGFEPRVDDDEDDREPGEEDEA